MQFTFKKILVIVLLAFITLTVSLILLLLLNKDKIIKASINEINKFITTKIEVSDDIDVSIFEKFPQASIKFQNVNIYESSNNGIYKMAHAGNLYLAFDIWNIVKSNYIINDLYFEDGYLNIKIDQNGKKNYQIIKDDSSTTTNSALDLKNIVLKNVILSYQNKPGKQFHHLLIQNGSAQLELSKEICFVNFECASVIKSFNINGDNYFSNKNIKIKSKLEYHTNDELLKILPSTINIENADFKIYGSFLAKTQKYIDLKIEEENGSIQTILSLLPAKFSKNFKEYKSNGIVFCSSTIKGHISHRQLPQIDINFGFQQASIFHTGIKKKITKANFYGSFTNGKNQNAQTSVLRIKNLHFNIDTNKFVGDFVCENFNNPNINFSARGKIDAGVILEFYKIKNLQALSGLLEFNVKFSGKLLDLKSKETSQRILAEGEFTLSKIRIVSTYTLNPIIDLNAEFILSNNNLAFSNLKAKTGTNDFEINGFIKNFVSQVVYNKLTLYMEGDLKSNNLNLNDFYIQSTNELSTVIDSNVKVSKSNQSDYDFQLNCDIKKLTYKKETIQNVLGTINYNKPHVGFKNFSFNALEGEVNLNSYYNTSVQNCNVQLDLKNVWIDSLFFNFNNFNQDFLIYKNLKGEISGSINAQIQFNKNFDVKFDNLKALVDAKILHGELINFLPLNKLSKFIDQKKLSHIKFSEISNKLIIENGIIYIPEMDIKSDASNLSIYGTHTFDQEMNYHLKVPIENFKKSKTDSDEVFGAVEEDVNGNANIFLTIQGTSNNYKIAYDTKRTKAKIKNDLKKEKQELQNLFKNKTKTEERIQEKQQEDYFDFDK